MLCQMDIFSLFIKFSIKNMLNNDLYVVILVPTKYIFFVEVDIFHFCSNELIFIKSLKIIFIHSYFKTFISTIITYQLNKLSLLISFLITIIVNNNCSTVILATMQSSIIVPYFHCVIFTFYRTKID